MYSSNVHLSAWVFYRFTNFCWTLNLWKDIWMSLWTPKPTIYTHGKFWGRSTGKKISVLQKDTSAWNLIKHLSVGCIYQFINLSEHHPPKVMAARILTFGSRRIPTFIFVSPSHVVHPRLPDSPGWESRQKTELKPSEWISFLRFAARFQKVSGGEPLNDVQNLPPCWTFIIFGRVDFRHVGEKCRAPLVSTKKSDLFVITRKSSICFWDYRHLIYATNWRHAYHVSLLNRSLLKRQTLLNRCCCAFLKSENLQKIHISFDISWTWKLQFLKEIPIYFSYIFYRKGPSLGIFSGFFSILTLLGCQGWLLQWRGGSRLVAWQQNTEDCNWL